MDDREESCPAFIGGFPASDIYNLDFTIAKFVYPRLVLFKKVCDSYPQDMSFEEWNVILDKIILSMYIVINMHEDEPLDELQRRLGISAEEMHRQFDEGMLLFGRYFAALWR